MLFNKTALCTQPMIVLLISCLEATGSDKPTSRNTLLPYVAPVACVRPQSALQHSPQHWPHGIAHNDSHPHIKLHVINSEYPRCRNCPETLTQQTMALVLKPGKHLVQLRNALDDFILTTVDVFLQHNKTAKVALYACYGLSVQAAQHGKCTQEQPGLWPSKAELPGHRGIDIAVHDFHIAAQLSEYLTKAFNIRQYDEYTSHPIMLDTLFVSRPGQQPGSKPVNGYLLRFVSTGCQQLNKHLFYRINIAIRPPTYASLVIIPSPIVPEKNYTLPVETWQHLWQDLKSSPTTKSQFSQNYPLPTKAQGQSKVVGLREDGYSQLACTHAVGGRGLYSLTPKSTEVDTMPASHFEQSSEFTATERERPTQHTGVQQYDSETKKQQDRQKQPQPKENNTLGALSVALSHKATLTTPNSNHSQQKHRSIHSLEQPPEQPRKQQSIVRLVARFFSQYGDSLSLDHYWIRNNLIMDTVIRIREAWVNKLITKDEVDNLWQRLYATIPVSNNRDAWIQGAKQILCLQGAGEGKEKDNPVIALTKKITVWKKGWQTTPWIGAHCNTWWLADQPVKLNYFTYKEYRSHQQQLVDALNKIIKPDRHVLQFATTVLFSQCLLSRISARGVCALLASDLDRQRALLIDPQGHSSLLTMAQIEQNLSTFVLVFLLRSDGPPQCGYWIKPDPSKTDLSEQETMTPKPANSE